jgi:hypothetical protein
MSWEAFRLTSKSPSELLTTLGPHGVDDLMRQALNAVWRDYPAETRTYAAAYKAAGEMFDRNMKVWSKIKQPRPDAFFVDLRPDPADGFLRQAFVLCWMMLPRAGGRKFSDTHRILAAMFARNMRAWDEDMSTFTARKKREVKKQSRRPAKSKKAARKK